MSIIDNPMQVADIESVLAWVDTFKLSRPTKKINRDFSDAVLLAEMLSVHYPKLVEMHNYPPRNSHAMKLNNWMTLNRKVLKKLKLGLCNTTLEHLANSNPGIIERVLVKVREKVLQDEEVKKQAEDAQLSSGGSYYEAYGDEDSVLIVPLKTRVNGVLETVQQKVVNYNTYCSLKEELKDAKDNNDVLRQKVGHLESLIKLKEERIEELQKQLERKASKRKDLDVTLSNAAVPIVAAPSLPTPHSVVPAEKDPSSEPTPKSSQSEEVLTSITKLPSLKSVKSEHSIPLDVIVPIPKIIEVIPKISAPKIPLDVDKKKSTEKIQISNSKEIIKQVLPVRAGYEDNYALMERINSDDIFKEFETESLDEKSESDEFKDSVTDVRSESAIETTKNEIVYENETLLNAFN